MYYCKYRASFVLQELMEADIDWWSKYYASMEDYDKCGDYIEKAYDKFVVGPPAIDIS